MNESLCHSFLIPRLVRHAARVVSPASNSGFPRVWTRFGQTLTQGELFSAAAMFPSSRRSGTVASVSTSGASPSGSRISAHHDCSPRQTAQPRTRQPWLAAFLRPRFIPTATFAARTVTSFLLPVPICLGTAHATKPAELISHLSQRNETPNHALQRTAPAVTLAASSLRLSPTTQPSRQPPPSLSLGSLGAFAHQSRAMSISEDIPSLMPPTKLHGLKTSNSELVPSSVGLAFGRFESFEQPTFPEFCIRESLASSAASFFGVCRELHASRRSTRSSSTRLDRAAVLGCSPFRAPREVQLSRGSRSGVHRESRRCSRNSFTTSVPNRTAPNHALQRTAPRVTVAAISSLDPSPPSHLFP